MFDPKIIVADFKTSLAVKISVGETIGSIQNNLDDDGVALPNGKYFFTLDADNSQKEHITCDLNGKNLTNIRSVSRQGVETVGVRREHRIGASVIITDYAHIKTINDFARQYDGKWMGAVANFAALSALTGSLDGEARVTLDDSKIYIWSQADQKWNLSGAGGAAGTVYVTNKLGSEADGQDNRTFSLTSGSFPDKRFLQVYRNGILQEEGANRDYVATGSNRAIFNSVVLNSDRITMMVIAVDLFITPWSNVTGDLLPDINDAYDIGSPARRFKDVNVRDITARSYTGEDVINPDNLIPQTPGFLTGGTDHSALSVFQALANGGNNGRFRVDIDGVMREINANLRVLQAPTQIINSAGWGATTIVPATGRWQEITTVATQFTITSISVLMNNVAGTINFSLRTGSQTGHVIATGSATNGTIEEYRTISFPVINVAPLTKYWLVVDSVIGAPNWLHVNTDAYPSNLSSLGVNDFRFHMFGALSVAPNTLVDVAIALQSSIRIITNSRETVNYVNNRFVITSGIEDRTSRVLRLLAPTSGIDISGNGTIPYLDMAANGVETLGTGESRRLVRLDRNGLIDSRLLGNFSGGGQDGNVIMSTNTTLTRDMFYNNLTINTGVVLNPNGFRIFVARRLINNGTIVRNGNNGAAGTGGTSGAGGAGGAGGVRLTDGTLSGGTNGSAGGGGGTTSGGTGAAGGAGINLNCLGSNGSAGGSGGTGGTGGGGGAGGAGGVATGEAIIPLNINQPITVLVSRVFGFLNLSGATSGSLLSSSAGAGGGGGGGAGGGTGGGGGGGGGGGASGGVIYIQADSIVNNGTVSGAGGTGAAGGSGANAGSAGTGGGAGGGGGSGGAGGVVILVYQSLVRGNINVLGGGGGAGGAGGAGAGTGAAGAGGAPGINGNCGVVYEIQM